MGWAVAFDLDPAQLCEMGSCPTCGNKWPDRERVHFSDHNHNVFVDKHLVEELTAQQYQILKIFWEHQGQTVHAIRMAELLFTHPDDEPEDMIGLLKAQVSHIRAKLLKTPLRIENVWGRGYKAVLEA